VNRFRWRTGGTLLLFGELRHGSLNQSAASPKLTRGDQCANMAMTLRRCACLLALAALLVAATASPVDAADGASFARPQSPSTPLATCSWWTTAICAVLPKSSSCLPAREPRSCFHSVTDQALWRSTTRATRSMRRVPSSSFRSSATCRANSGGGRSPGCARASVGQVLGDVEVSDEQTSLGDQSVALGRQKRVEGVVWSRGTTVTERAA